MSPFEEKNPHPFSGIFITFEGIDGSGKTLQSESLTEKLLSLGYTTTFVRDPGGPPISEEVRKILLDHRHHSMSPMTELLLYEAARAQLVTEVIRPALEMQKIVICDRFTDSTLAYQGYGRSISIPRIHEANQWACGDTIPDRTYILDISWEESIQRLSKSSVESDRLEKEQESFYQEVKKGYHRIAEEEPQRIRLLDGSKNMNFLKQEILKDAINIIEQKHMKN